MKSRLCRLALLLAFSAAPAFGQCAMCYTSAKGASTNGQTAITRGVLTLLLPPIGMMIGLVGFAFRYNRHPHQQDVPESEQLPEHVRKAALSGPGKAIMLSATFEKKLRQGMSSAFGRALSGS